MKYRTETLKWETSRDFISIGLEEVENPLSCETWGRGVGRLAAR